MPERNQYVDVLKGVLILLVVLGHSIQRTSGFGYWPDWSAAYLPYSGYVTMPIFFAVSGYLCFGRVRQPLRPWLGRKFRQLMIPWAAWTLVYFVAVRDRYMPNPGRLFEYAQQQLVSPSLWYLMVLFLCGAVLVVGIRLGEWSLLPLGILLVLLPIPWLGSLSFYYWWFIAGYFFGRFEERLVRIRWIAWVTAALAYTGGCLVFGGNVGLWPRVLMAMAAGITATFLAFGLGRTRLAEPLAFIGARSLEIYVGQFLFVQLLIVRSPWNAAIVAVLATGGSLALGWVLGKNRWTDAVFLGGRSPRKPVPALQE